MMSTRFYLVLSAILFAIGIMGFLVRRSTLLVFMSVELMLNSCNLGFVALARQFGNIDGKVSALFVMVVASAELFFGLAIFVVMWRTQ